MYPPKVQDFEYKWRERGRVAEGKGKDKWVMQWEQSSFTVIPQKSFRARDNIDF